MNPVRVRSILILSFNLRLGLPRGLFQSSFPTKTVNEFIISPMRATWSAHIILFQLIILIIFCEAYTLRSSSLHTFSSLLPPPHSPEYPVLLQLKHSNICAYPILLLSNIMTALWMFLLYFPIRLVLVVLLIDMIQLRTWMCIGIFLIYVFLFRQRPCGEPIRCPMSPMVSQKIHFSHKLLWVLKGRRT